jgi:AcrR family transcriptional regulator
MARTGKDESEGNANGGDGAVGRANAQGEATRQRILDAALALFREHGYDGTGMRKIAERADVPVGNTYYYFAGKEALLVALAEELHAEHLNRCSVVLDRERDLKARLRGVIETYWSLLEAYESVMPQIISLGADPHSPLNPFGKEAINRRAAEIALFTEVVRGSPTKIHPEIAGIVPTLLWLYFLGLQRVWLQDATPRHERTRQVTGLSIDLVVRTIQLANEPLLYPLRKGLLQVYAAMGIRASTAQPRSGSGDNGANHG